MFPFFAFTLHIQKKLVQGLTVQYDYNAYFKICRINANALISFIAIQIFNYTSGINPRNDCLQIC